MNPPWHDDAGCPSLIGPLLPVDGTVPARTPVLRAFKGHILTRIKDYGRAR